MTVDLLHPVRHWLVLVVELLCLWVVLLGCSGRCPITVAVLSELLGWQVSADSWVGLLVDLADTVLLVHFASWDA